MTVSASAGALTPSPVGGRSALAHRARVSGAENTGGEDHAGAKAAPAHPAGSARPSPLPAARSHP